ncbi:MAG: substrate-binding domain-containing protein [Eubacteriales bacterium]
MKKTTMVAMVLAMVLTLGACSGPGSGNESKQTTKAVTGETSSAIAAPEKKDPKDITIAVVPQQLGNVVFLPAKEAAEAKAKELGINIEWIAPTKAEASEQVGVIEGLIEKGVDGIAISCNNPDALKDVLARAISEGIMVSTFDADSPLSGRAFYAGTANYQAGVICAQEMIKLFKDSGLEKVRIAQLEGIPGAFDIEARKSGFADTIKGTNLEIVYSGACDDDVDKAVELIESYTRANGESIDAWFMSGGWPYIVTPEATPEVNKWKTSDPLHKVVTMDVFPTSIGFFDKGLIDVAVGQSFYSMGEASVDNLYKLIMGEEIVATEVKGVGKFIDTGVQIITPENYKEQIIAE